RLRVLRLSVRRLAIRVAGVRRPCTAVAGEVLHTPQPAVDLDDANAQVGEAWVGQVGEMRGVVFELALHRRGVGSEYDVLAHVGPVRGQLVGQIRVVAEGAVGRD